MPKFCGPYKSLQLADSPTPEIIIRISLVQGWAKRGHTLRRHINPAWAFWSLAVWGEAFLGIAGRPMKSQRRGSNTCVWQSYYSMEPYLNDVPTWKGAAKKWPIVLITFMSRTVKRRARESKNWTLLQTLFKGYFASFNCLSQWEKILYVKHYKGRCHLWTLHPSPCPLTCALHGKIW